MEWDLGVQGLALLVAMSLVGGVVIQLAWGRPAPRWVWLVASGVLLVLGLFTSEVWFGWATEEELQPNIDGVSFDEVLLAYVVAVVVVAVVRLVTRRKQRHRTDAHPRVHV